ncbi:2-hydroxyacid dehydrogenase [Floccifex sp.]|uniref:2-hydroxyacid dehydrogenase n=1 Tax=Floccifex sp. TaxID=2815810 RepID=UPI003EFCBF08
MKVLYMDEGGAMDEYIVPNALSLGKNVELVKGPWLQEGDDLGYLIRKVETDGPDDFDTPEGFIQNPDAEIVIATFTPFSAKNLDALKSCHLIGAIRGGLENYDVKAATERGILIINANGHNAHAVSEYTVGMLLAETRNIARSHHATLLNSRANYKTTYELHGKTVGLVGFGYIGQLVAKELSGFDVNIIAYDPYVKPEIAQEKGVKLVELNEVFKEADFVSVHARLLPSTYHMIGKEQISLMKPSAYLINTARAGLVDTDALLEALQENRIAGASLDVFDQEPLPADSPFLTLDNVTLTPHRAGNTIESTTGSPKLVLDRIKDLIDGKPIMGIVNPEVLENPSFKEWLETAKERLGRQ